MEKDETDETVIVSKFLRLANLGMQSVTPQYSNPAAGALGGALAGAKLGSVIPGVGTAFGAIGGGLLGLLGG